MTLPSVPQIMLCYPSASLCGQLQTWSDQRGGRPLQIFFERSLAGIRRQVHRVDFVLVDATDEPEQASGACMQICEILGSDSMAVYTDIVHDGLEVLVRRLGVPLLLGPMSVSEWDDLFAHKFPRTIPLASIHGAAQCPPPEQAAGEEKTVEKSFPFKSIAG
jgi:hypothetical protein